MILCFLAKIFRIASYRKLITIAARMVFEHEKPNAIRKIVPNSSLKTLLDFMYSTDTNPTIKIRLAQFASLAYPAIRKSPPNMFLCGTVAYDVTIEISSVPELWDNLKPKPVRRKLSARMMQEKIIYLWMS